MMIRPHRSSDGIRRDQSHQMVIARNVYNLVLTTNYNMNISVVYMPVSVSVTVSVSAVCDVCVSVRCQNDH